MSRQFRDLSEVRGVLKSLGSLVHIIEMVDGKVLERVSDDLYKKCCDMAEHPTDADGTRDSTPSFTVCPSKELWYCFGCGARGDRFEYVSRKMNLDHIESIHRVADMLGFDLTPYYTEVTEYDKAMNALYEENNRAMMIAHNKLLSNQTALNYIRGRGISDESIEKFKLGYIDNRESFSVIPNSIALHLDRQDQFTDAILFPVCDVGGRMKYFQSRPFQTISGRKYIGPNDNHPMYSSDDRLYGFNVAKGMIRQFGGRLIGVEGAPDTIVCNQHGIPAVGLMGTVANENTFALLEKYRVSEFVLLLDGDKAGRTRSFQIAEKYMTYKTNVRLRIANVPDGDPDEIINAHGRQVLIDIIDKSKYAIEFILDKIWDDTNPSGPSGMIAYIYSVGKYIQAIQDTIIRSIVISYIAKKAGFDPLQIEDYYNTNTVNSSGVEYNIEGEEIILGETLRNPEIMADLIMRFGDDDWYLFKHKSLYKLLRQSKHFDVDSIFIMAKNRGWDQVVTREWLIHLFNKSGNFDFMLDDVEDKLIRRKSRKVIDSTNIKLNDLAMPIDTIVDQHITSMYDTIHRRANENVFDAVQQVDSVMDTIHDRMANPGDIIGYSLGGGFKKTTQAILGLQTKTLTVVAANQSVGKTQICHNWAMYQAVIENVPTGWFSLEMDKDRMTFRGLSMLSGVQATDIMTGNLTVDDKFNKIDPWALKLRNAPFYLSEKGHDLTEAIAIAGKWVKTNGVKIIYIDYAQLQYISDRRTEKRYQELGMISKAWKQFAKEMDVAIVLVSQLNKEALNSTVARAEHGAGSYEIAQDADNYMTLKLKEETEIQKYGIEQGNITLNIDKNRMGEREIFINVYADRAIHRMSEA